MSVLFLLLIVSLLVAGGFLLAFIWAMKSGQYDDSLTPSIRMLFEEKISATDNRQKPLSRSNRKTTAGANELSIQPSSSAPSAQISVSSAASAFPNKQPNQNP